MSRLKVALVVLLTSNVVISTLLAFVIPGEHTYGLGVEAGIGFSSSVVFMIAAAAGEFHSRRR